MTTLELKPAYMVEIESKLATYAVAFAKGGSSHAERDDLLAAISAIAAKPAELAQRDARIAELEGGAKTVLRRGRTLRCKQ